jgi:hypothetical protein
MEVIEEDEYEILNVQVFTPMSSNDENGKDMPFFEILLIH